MHPVLFQIGHFTVGTYGLMIVLGMLSALGLASRLARREGLAPEFFHDLLFVVLLSGFLGARLLYILLNWTAFLDAPWALIFSRQGFVFLGGLLAAIAAAVWFGRRRGVPILAGADVTAPAVALAHAFGRVGCFLAGCCYGRVCNAPIGVRYPLVTDAAGHPMEMFNFAWHDQVAHGLLAPDAVCTLPMWPVPLFESAGNLLICLGLLALGRRRRFPGQVFAAYLGAYGVMRFGLEFLRGDATRGLWFGDTLSTSQLVSLAMIAASVALGLAARAHARKAASSE